MPTADEVIECRPSVVERVGAGACALLLPAFLFALATWPHPLGLGHVAATLFLAAGFLTPAAWAFRTRYRADAQGVAWRTTLGRAEGVLWSEVLGVDAIPEGKPQFFRLRLGRDAVLGWHAHWPGAQRLADRVRAQLARDVYRSVGDRLDDVPVRFTFVPPWRRARWWIPPALAVAAVVALCAQVEPPRFAALASSGRMGETLFVAVLFLSMFGLVPIFLAHQHWIRRREGCDETLVLDRKGFTVEGGRSPFRAAWNDVVTLTPVAVGSLTRLRVSTAAGDFAVPDVRHAPPAAHAATAIVALAPAEVSSAWRIAHAALRGDAATALPDGARRHGFRFTATAPWAVDAVLLLFAAIPIVGALVQRPDDAPVAMPITKLAAAAAVGLGAVLLHRLARALVGVATTPAGCRWGMLWRRRRFAWSEVVAVTFPDGAHIGLTLRLADGARLWCLPELLAGQHELIATLRDRTATAARGDA